ncbi:MAG: flagellar basal body P-ring protein FlgI [Planctomycetota bacterium]
MRRIHLIAAFAGVLATLALPACGPTEADLTPRDPLGPGRDVDPALRGTVGSQAIVSGLAPAYVSGIGFVVGLNGTGSGDVPASVRAWLVSEMTRLGIGRGDGPLSDVTPDQLIDDPNTSVVLVEAAIPAAAPDGFPFDVIVAALDGGTTTSLEGGRLWTTDLYPGRFIPGGADLQAVARAEGDVFINPFAPPIGTAEPDATTTVLRTRGRVLSGGIVSTRYSPTLLLDNPSHSRARAIAYAINTRFGVGGARDPVAIGRTPEVVEINVPPGWVNRVDEFFNVISHLRVDSSFPARWAENYTRTLVERPELAEPMMWSLIALGRIALPAIRPLYDNPDRAVRLAALEAGSKLEDPLTKPHLFELAAPGSGPDRLFAVDRLAELPDDPAVDLELRNLLSDDDLAVRVSAYESLERRRDPFIRQRIMSDKFVMHRVPAGEPMVYVTQQRVPRIALFGDDLTLEPTSLVSAWDRTFMVRTDGRAESANVFYRDPRTGAAIVNEVRADAPTLVEYLAHKETPETPADGLDLSYSQVVGALNEVIVGGGLDAYLVPEADRLALERLKALNETPSAGRPELSTDGPIDAFSPVDFGPGSQAAIEAGLTEDERRAREIRRARYVVPLRRDGEDGEPASTVVDPIPDATAPDGDTNPDPTTPRDPSIDTYD